MPGIASAATTSGSTTAISTSASITVAGTTRAFAIAASSFVAFSWRAIASALGTFRTLASFAARFAFLVNTGRFVFARWAGLLGSGRRLGFCGLLGLDADELFEAGLELAQQRRLLLFLRRRAVGF